ncbi:2'-5' RNA ligase family protein [uncultured Pedobacter sp.]|uniref:2'-5' RNA ligase family protein n=1 Tax=uncultured Pedobacter sp. TaxID=246139 RepID=UPI0025CF4AB7|nr:2'-5' RNA ligase family protein [uncultured Pedobacter sp.]
MQPQLYRDWYSIVVYPHSEAINDVKVLKDTLWSKIGWYASRNSEAHITVIEFSADQYELDFYVRHLEKFCYSQKQQEVIFDQLSLSKFSHAIVLLPNNSSKPYLNDLLVRLRKQLKTSDTINGSGAHISIGRKLTSDQIDRAENLYDYVNVKFTCDTIAIRRFCEINRQFEIIKTFKFPENPCDNTQYLLF